MSRGRRVADRRGPTTKSLLVLGSIVIGVMVPQDDDQRCTARDSFGLTRV